MTTSRALSHGMHLSVVVGLIVLGLLPLSPAAAKRPQTEDPPPIPQEERGFPELPPPAEEDVENVAAPNGRPEGSNLETAVPPAAITAPAAPASDRTVGNGCTYPTIAAAITAANPGDRLLIEGGVTFTENIVVGKSLTLLGGYPNCASGSKNRTVINGNAAGRTVIIYGGPNVTMENLEIINGLTGTEGGGIRFGLDGKGGTLNLRNVRIHDNEGQNGGGLWVGPKVVATASSDTEIYNNTATAVGGGVRVYGGTFVGDGTTSDIYGNAAPDGGGISATEGGVVLLDGSDLYDNHATGPTGRGGGVHLAASSVLTLTNTAWIYDGHTAYDGAGIYADASQIYLTDGVLCSCTAAHYGGGIYLANGSSLTADRTWIGYPIATWMNRAMLGAGLYTEASTVDFNGWVINNEASVSGAGLYADASTVHLTDAMVGGTESYRANLLGADGHRGVGLFLDNGTHAVLDNTTVASNTFQTADYAYGGGAYVSGGSALTLTNSTIERHVAPSSVDGRGAAIYAADSIVTLDNSHILTNTAGAVGGGIRLYPAGAGTLNIINGSQLRNNRALTGEGGAIAAAGNGLVAVNLADVTLWENTAATRGGAIYQSVGTLDFTGGWTLRSNEAGEHGGAIAIAGSADADFSADSYCLVYDNVAKGGSGGALYLANGDRVDLHAISGARLYIYANAAQMHGGALAADNGGYFSAYGQVSLDHNWATTGNGGAIYLSNFSKVWLRDYMQVRPEMWDNRAYAGHGGAIYAEGSPQVRLDGAILGKGDEGNQAQKGSGGAIYLSNCVLTAENSTFEDNRAAVNGGAIAAEASSILDLHANLVTALSAQALEEVHAPDAVNATACDPATRQCSALLGNIADSDGNSTGYGGAIYVDNSSLTTDQTYLHHNQAYRGGAIYQTGTAATLEVENSLFYRNSVTEAFGAGIRSVGGTLTLRHTTFADNLVGAAVSQSGTIAVIHNSIAWGNDIGFWGDFPDSSCNIDQQGQAGLAVDPRFVDPGNDNYRLLEGSPAIDACASGLPTDLDGLTRPLDDAYDMGAYEGGVAVVFLPLVLKSF